MTTNNKIRKYVAKRTNADRANPTAEPTILGFVEGTNITEAGALARGRYGEDGEGQMIYLVPLSRASVSDIVLATEIEADKYYGPSYGKRRRVVCVCGSACYFHPKQPRDVCMHCGKVLTGLPDLLVDMAREARSWAVNPNGN